MPQLTLPKIKQNLSTESSISDVFLVNGQESCVFLKENIQDLWNNTAGWNSSMQNSKKFFFDDE